MEVLIMKFQPGRMVMTAEASLVVPQDEMIAAMRRHLSGDWGDVDKHDWQVNQRALKDGSRIISSYKTKDGTEFWIITDACNDAGCREVTTVLLPSDY